MVGGSSLLQPVSKWKQANQDERKYMTKNMTRKSIALGAALALVVTGFAGLPANAAGLADTSFVSLAPSAGTEYSVLAGANKTFTLRANEASTLTTGNVSFLVEDSTSSTFPAAGSTGVTYADAGTVVSSWTRTNGVVSLTMPSGHGLTTGEIIAVETALTSTTPASKDVAIGYYTVVSGGATVVTFVDGGDDVSVGANAAVTALGQSNIVRAASGNFVVNSGISTSATSEDLILAVMGTTTVSVPVTAWKDANGSGVIDSTEYASPVRTVQFIKGSEVTAVVSADSYIVGALNTTAVGYAVTTPALNGNFMSTGDVELRFTHQGSAVNNDVNAVFNTTSRKWSVASDAAGNIAAGTHTVAARIGTTAVSPVLTLTVVAAKAADGLTAITQDVNNNVAISGADDATSTVRASTLAVSATMSFVDALEAVVPAGRPVKVTVTTLTSVSTAKVNGTAVAQGDVLDLVTDANGSIVANVTATAAGNGAALVLTGVAEGVAGSSTVATFNWATAAYTLYDLNNTADLQRSIAKGSAYTFNFAALDQWAQALSGDYRLKVAVSGNSVSESYTAFSAGSASVTVADAQLADGGDITVVVTPQKLQADATYGTTGAPVAVTYVLKPSVQTGAAVSVTQGATQTAAVGTVALAAGDTRTTQSAVTASGPITISGVVSSSVTAVARAGAMVTVSGDSSLLFVNGTKAAFGSLSFYASATGTYSVTVASTKSQVDSVVTVSSQDASKTTKVTFGVAIATAGKAITVTAPDYVAPGSTMVVSVKLTDKFGNAVKNNNGSVVATDNAVTVTYTGPGLIVGNISNMTDANGEITFRVLLGTNDTGSASVSAVFQNNTSATTDDITVSKTVTVGAAPVVSDTKVNAGSFKGFVALYAKGYKGSKMSAIVAGKWLKVDSLASDFERVVRYTGAGYDIVATIYIDGVKMKTFNLTTK